MTELEATTGAREVHMQEETARALAQERSSGKEIGRPKLPWQRESRASFKVYQDFGRKVTSS